MGIAQANLRYGFGSGRWRRWLVAAERALESSIATIAEAHLPEARWLAEQGRHAEAEAEIQKALRLGPNSWEVNKEAARRLYAPAAGRRRIPAFRKAAAR